MKKILSALCLTLLFSLLWSTAYAQGTGKPPAPAPGRIIAYYFYNDYRCETCKKLEAWTGETINGKFADDLKKKTLTWQAVNVDQPDNKHFVKDFKIFTKQVVLVDMQKGEVKRWKNLDKIWSLLNNKEKFQAYIESELKAFKGGS